MEIEWEEGREEEKGEVQEKDTRKWNGRLSVSPQALPFREKSTVATKPNFGVVGRLFR